MSGASSATARSEPIACRCGSEVMPLIPPIPAPVRHRKSEPAWLEAQVPVRWVPVVPLS